MGRNKKKPQSLGSMGERGFLSKILPLLKNADRSRFIVPAGDDAAVMKSPLKTVLSMDGLTENTHFKLSWDSFLKKKMKISLGQALGWKLMGSSLSDLAAMGDARERWALVFLGGPASLSSDFLMDFYKGVRESCERYECALVGGDTVRADTMALSAAVGGTLKGRAVTRSGAKPGDFLCVAGLVGDAERGLHVLLGDTKPLPLDAKKYFVRRFFDHVPLFQEGAVLSRDQDVTALLDLSDSLQESIELLIKENNLGFEVNLNAIPTSGLYKRHFGIQPSLLGGGEDYSLLFTAGAQALKRLKGKISFSVIGNVLSASAGQHYFLNDRPFNPPRYFEHFN